MKTTKCRSCGAEIVWITTKSGKAMPCDAQEVEYQKQTYGKDFVVTADGETVRCEIVKKDAATPLDLIVDGKGYISHFATCPYANSHRHRR